jgi:hypothetical protein
LCKRHWMRDYRRRNPNRDRAGYRALARLRDAHLDDYLQLFYEEQLPKYAALAVLRAGHYREFLRYLSEETGADSPAR